MANEKSKSVLGVIRASRPSFRNPYDKLAFAIHASFLASGYHLVATGPPAFSDHDTSTTSAEEEEVGIDHWNDLEDNYAFVYVNPEKNKGSKKVIVKCVAMSANLLVDVLAAQDDDAAAVEPAHLQLSVADYVQEDHQGTNYAGHYKNFDKLVKNFDSEILSKLYAPLPSDKTIRTTTTSSITRQGTGHPVQDPTYPSGSETRDDPGHILDDPYRIVYPPVPVNPIGDNDLFPGPGAGMYPTRDNSGIGGSILLGPNDPRWFGMEGGRPRFPGQPEGVPPGARFDPYNPPGIPGFEPNRSNRYPGRPGRGIHPDLEHFGGGSDFI